MSSKNFYGLTGDVTIDGGILNVANTNVSGNVTSTSLLVSNVATLGTTKTFVVRASGGVYYIDEDARKSLELHEGQTYIFDLSHSSLASGPHPLEFATQPEGANSSGYTTGISATGTLGTAGAKKTFVVPAGAPTTLYYYCTAHTGMGGQINISPAAELVVSGRIVASGNVEASKITASANVEVTGNVVASKFVGDGSLLTSVTAATTSGLQVVTDNSPTTTNTIEFTNPTTSLRASSNIVATGNVTADHFIGDGSRLSGIVTSVTFGDAVDTGNISSNTLLLTNVKEGLVATGNVVTQGKFIGDGSELTGIVTSVNLSDAVDTGNTTSNTVQFTNTSTSLTASGNVEVTGNVIAGYFIGDGSRLTNLPGGSGGSGTSHWTKTTSTNELYYNTGSVGISNSYPIHNLSIGSNLYVDDDATDGVLMVTGNVHGTYFVGDGSRLINLPEGGGSTNWTTSGSPVNKIYYPQNPGTTSVSVGIMNAAPTHTLSVGSNLFVDDAGSNVLHVDGNITAESMFLGALGIRPAYPLDSVTDTGNVTPHTISFTNPTLGITTASNVEIGGALVVGKGTLGGSNLEVGEANLFVNTQLTRVGIATDQPAATLHVNGSLAVDGPLTFGTVDVAAQHGLEAITAVDNTTPLTIELQNADTSLVTTGNVEVGGNVITSKDLTVTGNVTTNSELVVAGNVFYTNLMSVSVKSNVVAEYTGPHDRPLRKYPEVALTADAETVSGYKGYKVTTSSLGGGDGTGYRVFDGNYADSSTVWGSGDFYNSSDGDATVSGAASTTVSGVSGAVIGEWIGLQLPNKIRLQDVKIAPQSYAGTLYGPPRTPTKGVVAGSIDGTNWELVHSFTTSGISQIPLYYLSSIGPINSTKYYNYFRIIAEEIVGGTNGTRFNLEELCFYGYEEGSGSLDTTLKSVYNVPATTGTQLEVYYDGQDYTADTDFDQANEVLDKSGNNLHGSQNGGVGFDSTYKAFTFDGNGDYIRTSTLPSVFEGDPNLTQSAWVYFNELSFTRSGGSDFNSVLAINASGEYNIGTINELAVGSDGIVYHSSGARGIKTSNPIISDNWYHITVTKTPGNTGNETQKIYINGVLVPQVPWNASGTQVIGANPILTIGGSGQSTPDQQVKGSIANVRLYSKVLNAEQIQELYDYQKDYFLGSKSQVTLYKGHLGVGVTEPSGQLELAGDERIQEYPPRAMTGYETLVEGHGVFCASASSYYNYITHLPWQAFTPTSTTITDGWNSGDNSTGINLGYYAETASGEATSAAALFEGTRGEWVQLKCPYPIIVKKFAITGRSNGVYGGSPEDQPKSGILYGSNDGNNWDILANFSGLTYGGASGGGGATGGTEYVEVNATKGYTRLVLQATARVTNYGTDDWINIGQLRYFGTPGPTTLDKGSLTLGRSLDVPRVSRYDVDTETPRPEKLVVDFDTTVNSSPTDISGKGNHGAFYGNAQYSPADKAFKFDGSTDYIKGNLNNTGDTDFTVSLWLKKNTSGTVGMLWNFGGSGGSGNPEDSVALEVASNNNLDYFIFSGAQGAISNFGVDYLGKWVHIVATRSGNNLEIYLDGVDQNLAITGTDTLQLAANTEYTIGARGTGALGNNSLNGYISNFKVYNVVLEPSEVRKLYNLGRTGRSMVISDTAVGIGRAPEAQLDVRGIGKFETCHIRDGGISGTHGMLDINEGLRTAGSQIPPSHTPPLYITGDIGPASEGVEIRHSNQSQGIGFGYNTIYATGYASNGSQDLSLKAFGTGTVRLDGGTAVTSDDRLKTNEQYLTNATETLLKLKPQLYDKHKKINETCDNPMREAGLITQDVYYDAPELRFLVHARNEGMDAIIPVNIPEEKPFVDDDPTKDPDYSGWGTDAASLNYGGIIPYLIKSNQEIYNELQAEKVKNEALETQVSDLLARVTALENA